MKRFHPILILLPGLVLLVTVYVLITVRYITTTGILKEADYKIFHTAGRITQTAGYSQLYNLKTQLQVQDTLQIDLRHIVLGLRLRLFTAPHLHYHDLALMALSLFALGLVAIKSGKWTFLITISLSLFASVLLSIGEWWDPLRFTTPYLLMSVLPLLTRWVNKRMNNKIVKSEGACPGYSNF